LNRRDKRRGVGHREFAELAEVLSGNGNGERLGLEAHSLTVGALRDDHILFKLGADRIARRLGVTPLDVRENALPLPFGFRLTALLRVTEKERLLRLRGNFPPRRIELELQLLREPRENHATQVAIGFSPREDDALENRDARIPEHELGARGTARAESAATRTGAKRRVERKVTGLELRQREATVRAAVLLAEELRLRLVANVLHDFDETVGKAQRGFERVCQATAIFALRDESVDDDRHIVIHLTIELRRLGELDQLTVDDGADETLLARILEQIAELTFPTADERREDFDAGPFGVAKHGVGDLSGALPLDGATTVRAVRRARAGVEQAQVVVDFGDGADRRARIVPRGLLLDRDGRRQPLDGVDVGLLHQPKKLARVGGQRLDVAALSFGENGIECERRFAGAREPGDDR
jgi:hypothetical protein